MQKTFKDLVVAELEVLRNKGRTCHGYHEAFGLIFEEFDEFKDIVRQKTGKRNPLNAIKELSQIAALCELVAIDMKLLEYYNKIHDV